MKNLAIHILLLMVLFFPACREKPVEKKLETNIPGSKKDVPGKIAVADNNTILSRKEVPILCYHRIHNFNGPGSDRSKGYQVTPAAFAEQMKALSDSGYHTILPDQL